MADSFLKDKITSLKPVKGKKSMQKKKTRYSSSEGGVIIEVDPRSSNPTLAWEFLKEQHIVHQLPTDTFLNRPRTSDHLRFVCLSDTHGAIEHSRREFHKRIPDGDVLIHCGDFSMAGEPSEIIKFDSFMSHLPHPIKLVIAGNHELPFEEEDNCSNPTLIREKLGLLLSAPQSEVAAGCKALLEHMMYLQDETVVICGIKIYGSPWVPVFGSWGFGVDRGEKLLEKWNQIPSDTDILITHGPPCGYGDDMGCSVSQKNSGCVELLNTVVKRVKPKYHVFGHIHNGHGMWTNEKTTFINAAVCNNRCIPYFDPIVFDFPLPPGYSRKDFDQLSTESLCQARHRSKLQHEAVASPAEDRNHLANNSGMYRDPNSSIHDTDDEYCNGIKGLSI